jgi:hypothetical protein
MGCGASVHVVESAVIKIDTPKSNDVCECLAGKFNRNAVPKELWLCRMREFIANHIAQFKNYSSHDIDIMYKKLHEYETNIKVANDNTKHSQAVRILSEIFNTSPPPSPKQLRDELTTMALDYCVVDKEHEFEEVVFVFSIIINSPMIKLYETKY